MPTIPPNNTSGLYGIDSSPVVVDNGDISVGNIYAAGNATVEGNLTVGGTIYGNVIGNVIGNLVVPGSNTEVLFNQDGNAGASSNLTFNTDTGLLDVNGNVSANYFIGDGSQLTGLPASYGNSNVSTYLASGTDTANIITTGNVTGGNLTTSGNTVTSGIKTDNYYYANGTPISFAGTYGNSNVSAYLASGTDTANIVTTGNISGQYILGNGSQLTGLPATYGNSNVDAHLAAFGSNTISTTGNITAGYFSGDGSLLTNINAGNISGSYGNANVAAYLPTYTGAIAATQMTANSVAFSGDISALSGAATISGVNLGAGAIGGYALYASGSLRAGGADIVGNASITGNVTGANIIGNGQYLTNLPGGNVTGQVANALVAGTVYTAAQPNITSVGTLTSLNVSGNAIVGGNLTVNGNTIYTNITELNVQDPIISQGRGPNNTPLVSDDGKDRGEQFWYYTSTEKSAFSGYDNSAGKMLLATDVSIANEIVTVNSLGNVVAGNLEPTSVVASGNITGSYIIGNGSTLSSLTGANVTGTVPLATSATTAGTVTTAAQPNITSVGTLSSLTVTGNVTSGNVIATHYGSGAGLSSLTGANVTGTVANATYAVSAGSATTATTAGTVTTAAQPNITSVGTLSSLSVTGNITSSANISGSYILGNGSQLTGIVSSYGNSNVAAYLASGSDTSNIITTGNVTGGNLITSGTNGSISGVNYLYANTVSANTVTTSGKVISGAVSYTNVDGISGQVLTTYGNGVTYFATPSGGSYGDANVVTLMSAFGSNTISTTGNITGGNIIGTHIGSGAALTSLTGANVTGTVANATYATSAGSATTATSATTAGTVTTAAQPNITSVGTLSSLAVTGNITGGNISLTGNIVSTNIGAKTKIYTDGAGFNAYGTNDAASGAYVTNGGGNILIGAHPSSGVLLMTEYGTTNRTMSWNQSNLTVAGNISASFGNILCDRLMGTTAGNLQALVGVVIAGNVTYTNVDGTAGQVLTTYGNGKTYFSTVSGGSYGDSNVNTLLSSWGSNTLSTTGNVTAGYFIGNGSTLSSLTGANVTGTVANATYATSAGSATTATTAGTVTTAAQPNITSVGTLTSVSVTGNATVGNILTNGYYYANGTAVTFGGTPAGSSLELQFNNAGSFGGVPGTAYYAGNGRLSLAGATFEQSGSNSIVTVPGTSGYISVTGNVTAGNLIATTAVKSGAITITGTDGTNGQVLTTYGNGQTYFSTVSGGGGTPGGSNTQLQFNDAGSFAGNAAMTFNNTTGNISFGNLVIGNTGTSGTYYNVLTNKNPFLGNTSTQPSDARILIGSGKNGDWSTTVDYNSNARNSRVVIADEYVKSDNGVRAEELSIQSYANLNGATTFGSANINSRIQGIVSDVYVMNGNITASGTGASITRGIAGAVTAGTGANANMSNVSHASGMSGSIVVNTGSSVGNAFGLCSFTSGSGVVGTQVGLGIQFQGNANSSGNVFGVYMAGGSSTYGVSNGGAARGAANYYFLRTDDPLAKNQIGQMNRYFDGFANCGGSSGGAVTINATNGQFQYLNITEAVTSISFTNFLNYTLTPSSTTVPLADTVTLIITQDATGRSITMPTSSGSNIYKYAGGVNTVGTTANSVTMVSITSVLDGSANNLYLITISPEFS